MSDSITLTIDNRELSVPAGTLIVDAAKRVDIDIPVFCYHPKLPSVGMCRMCLVEVGTPALDRESGEIQRDEEGEPIIRWFPTLQTACTMPVSQGMVVRTRTERVKRARRDIIEFLLTSHPLDCPICDKGGECPLQNQTMAHGVGVSRFEYGDKQHLDKRVPLGDLIVLDRERCIQCGRCVRFQHEIARDPVLAFNRRGRTLDIITCSDPPFDSYFGGNTTDICPVGALTTTDFRFGARPWELTRHSSVCNHCPVGCNVTLDTRVEGKSGDWEIERVMPRQNEQVNEIWICDKGRYGHHHARAADRLKTPYVRKDGELVPASWDDALNLITTGINTTPPAQIAGIAGDRLSNEDLFVFQSLMRNVIGTPHIDAYPGASGADLIAWYGLSSNSDWDLLDSKSVILIVAGDVEEQAPIWSLRIKAAARRGTQLIVVNGRNTKLDRYASHQLRIRYGSAPHLLVGLTHLLQTGTASQNSAELLGEALGFDATSTERLTGIAKVDLDAVTEMLSTAENAIIILGREGLNDFGVHTLAQAAARLLVATGTAGRSNSGLLPLWPHNNTQGAADMGIRPNGGPGYQQIVEHGWDFNSMLSAVNTRGITLMWFVGADPVGDDPALAEHLDKLPFLVVQELFLTETAQLADVVLPALSFAERDGTFTSGDRRVQWFDRALPPSGEGRPDWAILTDVAHRLGTDWSFTSASAVLAAINSSVPLYADMTLDALQATATQWPPVGGDSIFFGGTAYQNQGGLGVRWPAAVETEDTVPSLGQIELPALHGGDLTAVPTRRLYQHGTLIDRSLVLEKRRRGAVADFHPHDAQRLGLVEGMPLVVELVGRVLELTAHLAPGGQEGAVLIPSYFPTGPLTVIMPTPVAADE